MRLWHKEMLKVLPGEQLVLQWRELSTIAGNLKEKGTPNHILVNKILEYETDDFCSYAFYVREEMKTRGYKTSQAVWDKIFSINPDYRLVSIENLFYSWHDDNYLKICYYNLYEKFLCGGVTSENWYKIHEYVINYFWGIIE